MLIYIEHHVKYLLENYSILNEEYIIFNNLYF